MKIFSLTVLCLWIASATLGAALSAPAPAASMGGRVQAPVRDRACEQQALDALRAAAERGALFTASDLRSAMHGPLPVPERSLPSPRRIPLDESALFDHAARSTLALYCAGAKNARSMAGAQVGAAYVIHPSGIAVTCLHALRHSEPFAVTAMRSDGRIAPVTRILSVRPRHDLVFLQLGGADWTAIPLRPDAPAGIRVRALGHPLGVHFFMIEGLLSRYEDIATGADDSRAMPRMNLSMESGSGFSGGPVLDAQGNALGMIDSMRTIRKDPERYTLHSAIPAAVIRSAWDESAPAPMSEEEIEKALDPEQNEKSQAREQSIIRTQRPEGEILTARNGGELRVRVVDPSGHILFSGAPSEDFRDRLPEWARGAYDENLAVAREDIGAGPDAE